MSTCWIFRGPPGSGKTTAAKKLYESFVSNMPCEYISLDAIREDKGYVNDWEQIKANMQADVTEMERQIRRAFEDGVPNVIVDNVHSRFWEYEQTFKAAEAEGYVVHVLEIQSDLLTCWQRQSHPVPWNKLFEIFERWESPLKIPDTKRLLGILAQIINRTGITGMSM